PLCVPQSPAHHRHPPSFPTRRSSDLNPVFSSLPDTTGYTTGGLAGKFFFTAGTTMAAGTNFGISPGSVLSGVQPNDGIFRNFPVDRKSTRLNSSHRTISYAVFCLKKK